MSFNSPAFFIFLSLVFIGYWGVLRSRKNQNILILIASYTFYGWWDYRFLFLIALSTVIDYFAGIGMEGKSKGIRKLWLYISLFANLGLLGFFKYYNFFISSWVETWESIGIRSNLSTLNIILPVGISFYTFQTLSYTIDVFQKRIRPTKNLVNFATFVAFFPQLVAGPIERASQLLPQFSKTRIFDSTWAISGLHLILWGLFKKVVIADSCAIYANSVFENFERMNSLSLLMGVVYFSFQIYADFSAYSDIAVGTARLLGFDLMQNFNFPYFSRNIAEFWRRWHISLSTWFRDYVYIPLGGSRGTTAKTVRNIFIIFLLSGLWHGANWTFVVWGGLHALFFLPVLLTGRNRTYLKQVADTSNMPSLKDFLSMLLTFSIVAITWIFSAPKTSRWPWITFPDL